MSSSHITLVVGPSGAGKTTWIREKLNNLDRPTYYLNLGEGTTPIDATYLAREMPQLTPLSEREITTFITAPNPDISIYIELGFQIDLKSLVLPIEINNCQKVAVLPPETRQTEWHDWAEVIVLGTPSNLTLVQSQLWRCAITGQILDPASLNTFWYELTNGAYGNVQRAKGIFDLADGSAFYFDFVAGIPDSKYLEFNLPRWLNDRPNHFSGIEVLGEKLDESAIGQTLENSCLNDIEIAYYQAQIKDSLAEIEEDEP
ncbi:MAG TPA: GTPase, G3E family protein [Cyanobacteria bacterium UBA11149]|nr:GTPase, G3E family protein [Cyanobacteria bacterium UBA11367]HBE57832.1 GTPase, G3E family protein [Cyanobacteria bacterium UBA11366]HBK66100.1 GTPase, G3E family protein [Cyanobacteria bacterium UBA11166]HBR73500.1 GTPase, G3E family protein [Cyanobacteria bacterium UBA11159]HBS68964.1 GTPase, G3E family protein [Cyanobacteria bacterium UBA11153]HBW91470.1 GTPase, G3E family protein [Cyanobacteria bacterium UBA11149]HCA96832.1 GTPase, G3E family protein [Cyanobacteria bacterium UBA9226]